MGTGKKVRVMLAHVPQTCLNMLPPPTQHFNHGETCTLCLLLRRRNVFDVVHSNVIYVDVLGYKLDDVHFVVYHGLIQAFRKVSGVLWSP